MEDGFVECGLVEDGFVECGLVDGGFVECGFVEDGLVEGGLMSGNSEEDGSVSIPGADVSGSSEELLLSPGNGAGSISPGGHVSFGGLTSLSGGSMG